MIFLWLFRRRIGKGINANPNSTAMFYLSTKECKFVDKKIKVGVESTGRMQGFETVLMISCGRVPSNSIISLRPYLCGLSCVGVIYTP